VIGEKLGILLRIKGPKWYHRLRIDHDKTDVEFTVADYPRYDQTE
jgi:hypothetical protein